MKRATDDKRTRAEINMAKNPDGSIILIRLFMKKKLFISFESSVIPALFRAADYEKCIAIGSHMTNHSETWPKTISG